VSRIYTDSAKVEWEKVMIGKLDGYIITLVPTAGRSPYYVYYLDPLQVDLTGLTRTTEYNVTIQSRSGGQRSEPASKMFTTGECVQRDQRLSFGMEGFIN
jgi:hypothetical protein